MPICSPHVLRIGYIVNSSRYEWLLRRHHHNRFMVFCYTTKSSVSTSSFRRDLSALSTADAVRLIVEDKIDILVDTIGFGEDNRMDVVVRKPAPIVVGYDGTHFTSGLKEVDYLLTDKITGIVVVRTGGHF